MSKESARDERQRTICENRVFSSNDFSLDINMLFLFNTIKYMNRVSQY